MMTSKELQCIQAVHDFRMFYARGKSEKLRVLVDRYKQKIKQPPLPENKSVLELWRLHGINQNRHGEHRAIWLLNQWLDMLYGEGTAKSLDVEGRCRQRQQTHIRMNAPFYQEENAPHFHFRNPFDCVLEKVSEELPPYQ